MNTKQIFGLIMASILAAFSGTAGAVVHVDPGATGFNNGTSWENAYTSVKLAVDNSPAGSEIWVASGKYYPTLGTTDRTDSIALKSGMKLYGGVPARHGDPGAARLGSLPDYSQRRYQHC